MSPAGLSSQECTPAVGVWPCPPSVWMAVGRPYLSPAAGGASFARRGVRLGRLHRDDPAAPRPGR
eukprot:9217101-Lingulodinium_polyedra.AAC.1